MLITTSRKPSRRSRTLGRDLARVLGGKYITRGKGNLERIVSLARNAGHTRVVLIYDIHGNPGKLESIIVEEDSWSWHPLIVNLSGVRLQREFGRKVLFKDLTLENKTKHDVTDFFGFIPAEESRNRIVVTEERVTFYVANKEVGPRLSVKEWYYASRPKV